MTDIPSIGCEKMGQLLFDYLLDNVPDELDALSTHTILEGISDVEIDSEDSCGEVITVKGKATIEVELNYGSDYDRRVGDGDSQNDYYAFVFITSITDDKITSGDFKFNLDHFYE